MSRFPLLPGFEFWWYPTIRLIPNFATNGQRVAETRESRTVSASFARGADGWRTQRRWHPTQSCRHAMWSMANGRAKTMDPHIRTFVNHLTRKRCLKRKLRFFENKFIKIYINCLKKKERKIKAEIKAELANGSPDGKPPRKKAQRTNKGPRMTANGQQVFRVLNFSF